MGGRKGAAYVSAQGRLLQVGQGVVESSCTGPLHEWQAAAGREGQGRAGGLAIAPAAAAAAAWDGMGWTGMGWDGRERAVFAPMQPTARAQFGDAGREMEMQRGAGACQGRVRMHAALC